MSTKTQEPTAQDAINALVEALKPKEEKKEAKKDRILVVNGKICPEFVTMKEAKKAAKQYATTDAKIEVYQREGSIKVELPVEVK